MEGDHGDDGSVYAELERQILLLTADEDDNKDGGGAAEANHNHQNLKTATAALRGGRHGGMELWEHEAASEVPAWLSNLWRVGGEGKGTGVFIPYALLSKRKTKSAQKNRRTQRQRGRKAVGA